jgi:anti-sigma B factor antagonist
MEIRERLEGPLAVVELAGRFTVTDPPGVLKDAVTAAVDRGARHVLLDLSGVRYIDSTRLGELIAAHVNVNRRGSTLKLVATPPRIAELLTMAGLDDVFQRFDSIGEATKHLS